MSRPRSSRAWIVRCLASAGSTAFAGDTAFAAALVLAACAALAGCGASEPRWVDLARLGVQLEPPEGEIELTGGRKARIVRTGEDLWITTTLVREDWRASGAPGRFRAALPLVSVGVPRAAGAPYRLRHAGGDFAYEPNHETFGKAGTFSTRVLDLDLDLALEPGSEPPGSAELDACLNLQRAGADGLGLAGRRHSGSGFWVTPGRPATLELDLPPDSSLRFATLVEPVQGSQAARLEPQTFRVRLDGVLLFETRQEQDVLGESCAWHALDLPRGGVQRARLCFEVEGGFALTSFLAPMIAPRELGTPAARPWQEARPR